MLRLCLEINEWGDSDNINMKRKTCPKCNSKNDVSIVYGLPDEKLGKEAEEGKIHLGGCCVTGNDPKWHCNDCENDW